MNVQQINGEPGRVRVTSEQRPDKTYAVDVRAFNGNGQCDCPHFRMRLQPWMGRRHAPLRCKHIEAAREFVLDAVLAMWSREDARRRR